MKVTTAVLSLALATLGVSQDLSSLPQCSLTCLLTAVGSVGCQVTDFSCSCGQANALTASVTPCVQGACSTEDQATVASALQAICSSVGVPISVPAVGATSAAESSAAETTVATTAIVDTIASILPTGTESPSLLPITTAVNATVSVTQTPTATASETTGTDSSAAQQSTGAAAKLAMGAAGLIAGLAYVV